MSGLDVAGLRELHEVLTKRLDGEERRQRTKPLFEAMQQRAEALTTMVIPDFMADSVAEVRKSHLVMEKSMAAFPEKYRAMEAGLDAKLARVRARTRMLEEWLEVLG